MGGSFNPPTMAHFHLLQAAIDGIQAEKGIFEPVSKACLKRKTRKTEGVQVCFSETDRARMLEYMAAGVARMEVSDIEFGTYRPRSFETMCDLQRQHLDADLYFLIGTDKFAMMSRMRPDNPFLNKLLFLVFCRDGQDAKRMIIEDATLSKHKGQFTCLTAPQEADGISSSSIRELYLHGSLPADASLHPDVKKVLEGIPVAQFHREIYRFEGKYGFLSPYHHSMITVDDLRYRDSVSAFLSMLCARREEKKLLSQMSGTQAVQFWQDAAKPEIWEKLRENAMLTVQRLKFQQHPDLATRLAATGEANLIYGSDDLFWGEDLYRCEGENRLGRILMAIRDEIKRGVK